MLGTIEIQPALESAVKDVVKGFSPVQTGTVTSSRFEQLAVTRDKLFETVP
jgi:hypothetical protein